MYWWCPDPGCLLNIGGYLHRHRPDRQVKASG
jgi:hypothetical protein